MKKISLLLVVVMLLGAFLTGCGGGAADEGKTKDSAVKSIAVEGDTIKIGVFEPTTGEKRRRRNAGSSWSPLC